jgi:hypothetical protein
MANEFLVYMVMANLFPNSSCLKLNTLPCLFASTLEGVIDSRNHQ